MNTTPQNPIRFSAGHALVELWNKTDKSDLSEAELRWFCRASDEAVLTQINLKKLVQGTHEDIEMGSDYYATPINLAALMGVILHSMDTIDALSVIGLEAITLLKQIREAS
ncbi:MAG: hypothetical protein HOP20_09130 [Sulfuriferula sp.]|nr:hypothetical protein [Sulfuriferula sp.]